MALVTFLGLHFIFVYKNHSLSNEIFHLPVEVVVMWYTWVFLLQLSVTSVFNQIRLPIIVCNIGFILLNFRSSVSCLCGPKSMLMWFAM